MQLIIFVCNRTTPGLYTTENARNICISALRIIPKLVERKFEMLQRFRETSQGDGQLMDFEKVYKHIGAM